MIKKFRKKPVVIEAVRWEGGNYSVCEVGSFMGTSHPLIIDDKVVIETLVGDVTASIGDWIIKGVNGEFYPCKTDIFVKTYDPIEAEKDFLTRLSEFYA